MPAKKRARASQPSPTPKTAPSPSAGAGNAATWDQILLLMQGPPLTEALDEKAPAPQQPKKRSKAAKARTSVTALPTTNLAMKGGGYGFNKRFSATDFKKSTKWGGAKTEPTGVRPAARLVSAVTGGLNMYDGAERAIEAAPGDHLEQYQGAVQMAQGTAGVAAAAGLGGPLAPMAAAALGTANRGNQFAQEHLGKDWVDMSVDEGMRAQRMVTELTGSELAGDIAGGFATVASTAITGVGALATGVLGTGEDIVDTVAALPRQFKTIAGENQDRRSVNTKPRVPQQWSEQARSYVDTPAKEPDWAKPLDDNSKKAPGFSKDEADQAMKWLQPPK